MNQNFRKNKNQNQNSNRRPRNNNYRGRPNNNNNNNSPKGPETPGERVVVRYDQLQESHIQARKKYYEFYYRADPQQLDKLERTFDRTLVELREFEARLSPEDKEILKAHRNNLDFDYTYSENHQLNPEKYPIEPNLKIEDPHVLETQIKCDFKGDNEESVGTAEDYKKYKGLE